ncbi:HTH-type transcriptional regulator YesS [compost metagenome]
MNPNYFSKLFKQETGKNYIEYVTEARMEWASRLLKETPAKVSEIAKRVGYEDMKHFNQLFKRYSGETPSQYRSR